MKTHQTPIGKNDRWQTPPEITKPLGVFDLDPAADVNRPWDIAIQNYTVEDDGLSLPWFGRVWLNPPFNKKLRPLFMAKMCDHNNGIMLIPAAFETSPFKRFCFGKASGYCLLKTRPHFYSMEGIKAKANSGCTIVLVAYGDHNFNVLKESNLGHCLIEV